jgi:hypothetical protein
MHPLRHSAYMREILGLGLCIPRTFRQAACRSMLDEAMPYIAARGTHSETPTLLQRYRWLKKDPSSGRT